ncbi:helix-turn-helix domain-containing protein [Leptospirillum ferriphilum]|uniref:helix-turn-helix domain-containing protein n=1 Tax=Leptospirillum ferriphilum TaxID=178606 RepID=UPI000ACA409F
MRPSIRPVGHRAIDCEACLLPQCDDVRDRLGCRLLRSVNKHSGGCDRHGRRFRAYSTPAQEQILLQWIGHQQFIYNANVSEDRYYRTFAKKAVSLSGTPIPVDQEYARFIGPDTPWLRDVPSQILRNGAVHWKQAMTRFFSGLAGRHVFRRKDGRASVGLDHLRTFLLANHCIGILTKKFPSSRDFPDCFFMTFPCRLCL